jgi:hypothetical protein
LADKSVNPNHNVSNFNQQGRRHMETQDNRNLSLHEFHNAPDAALFSEPTIAIVCDCTVAKLRRDRWAGTGIPFIKMNRRVKYRKSDVLSWLSQFEPQQSTSSSKNIAA